MGSQFEHLKLSRIINIELPRRPSRPPYSIKRVLSAHGKQLLGQIYSLTQPVKEKNQPFPS